MDPLGICNTFVFVILTAAAKCISHLYKYLIKLLLHGEATQEEHESTSQEMCEVQLQGTSPWQQTEVNFPLANLKYYCREFTKSPAIPAHASHTLTSC
jgi:hypothetical protein